MVFVRRWRWATTPPSVAENRHWTGLRWWRRSLALPVVLVWPLYSTGILVVVAFGELSLPSIPQRPSTFDARVVEVHPVKRLANCTFLVGTWYAGMVQVGICSRSVSDGDLAVVMGVDWMSSDEQAKRIGLLVRGIDAEKATRGDRVVGAGFSPAGPGRSW